MGRLHALVVAIACVSPLAAPAVARQGGSADEQYQYLVGLAERGMHDRVVREGEQFLRDYASHPKADLARYRLAAALFALDRREPAREQFARLAGKRGFQFEAEVHFRLGQCELSADRAREAATAFERVLALDASYLHVPARFFLAEAQFRQERFEEAEQGYRALLAADGKGEYARDAVYGLAWCAFRRGQHADAVARTGEFLKRWGQDELAGEMHFLQGEALLAQQKPREAVAAYRRVETGPFADAALRGAAFALAEQGEHTEAAQQFAALLARAPDGRYAPEAALHAGVEWLRAGDPKRALAALSDRRVPAGPEALYWRGQAELESGDARAALATLDRALGARPEAELPELEGRLHTARGNALSALGRGAEAAESFARSGSEYALYAAAVEALNAKQYPDAGRMAQGFLERFPASSYAPETCLVLGEAHFAQGQHAAAEQAFTRVAPASGKAVEPALLVRATSRRAWCRLEQGDPKGAAALFLEVEQRAEKGAQAQAPEVAEARFMRGRALDAAGDARGAQAAWERYLSQHPEGKWRAQALFGLARLDEPAAAVTRLERLLAEEPNGELAVQACFELAERLVALGRPADARPRYAAVVERQPKSELGARARYGVAWCAYEAGDFAAAAAALRGFERQEALPAELLLAGLELGLWAGAKSGDARGMLESARAFDRAGGDDARVLAAAKVAVATLVAAGRAQDAKALIAGLLDGVQAKGVAASLLVEHAWVALDAKGLDEAEDSVRAAAKIADAAGEQGGASGAAVAEAAFFVGEARFDAGEQKRAAELYALAASKGGEQVAARAYYKEGFARLALGDDAGAVRAFTALCERYKTSELVGEGLFLLGETHFRAGRWAEAAAALERLRQEQPRHAVLPKALFRLGVAQAQLGRWAEAEEALTRLLRDTPDFENAVEAELWRGRALFERKNARGARAAYERVIALDKGVLAARARLGLGAVGHAAGEHEEALSQYLKVAVLYAQEAEVSEALLMAGQCLEDLGDGERAAGQYRELALKYPRSEFAARARERLRGMQQK